MLLPDGNLAVLRAGDLGMVEHVYTNGGHDKLFKPSEGFMIIDAGAHIGLYTLKAARLVRKKGLVIAVEPEPGNFKLLEWNIRINRLRNVIPLKLALTNFSSHTQLSVVRGGSSSIVFRVSDVFIRVRCLTLDQLVKKLKLQRVDLIKIDVEGAEAMALEGAKTTLKNNNIKLCIEIHSEDLHRKCYQFLTSLGYTITDKYVEGFMYAWK